MLEYTFRFRTRLPRVAALVEDLLCSFRIPPVAGSPTYDVVDDHQPWSRYAAYLEGQSVREYDSLEPVLDYLFWHINREAITSVTKCVVVHAAAASWEEDGVLMPAPMDSGKSTLVAGLTAAGFSYLSDEAAPLDPATGRLHPYPKPIWLERGSVEALPGLLNALSSKWGRRLGDRYHVRPEELSPVSTGSQCRVGYVIVPSYEAGSPTSLEPMSRAQGLLSLTQSCFNFGRFGKTGLALLSDVVTGARCYRLRMGDLESAVRAVADLVDHRTITASRR
ncbi:MAG: hypothetical protein ACRDJL_10635 [Actinomycetota bacterium]